MKARIATVAATLIVGFSAHTAAAGACEDPLKPAWNNWPPYMMPGDDGPKGIDPDILRAVAEEMGCEISWQKMPWKRTKLMLKKGQVDIGTQANINEKRKKYANFSDPYMKFQSALWKRSSDNTEYSSLEDFLSKGKKLRVLRGFEYGENVDSLINKKYKDQIAKADSIKINAKMLAAGRADGTLGNPFVVGYQAKQAGVVDKIEQSVTIQSSPVHFMLSKKSVPQNEIKAMNKALAKLKENGTIQNIVKKYTGTTIQ
ncbi:polar amino acid transport system substrate-binding protein [Limimonas halophila]|uniref:Polar amino acid transport system substrate-binding protein n=1 Tax=Limimonas halophila TaxID=1082479 RepID=A0A1G7T2N5_9PROT|nr:transporter substrate-binding domain-containing protein [Limimonas halophila]SDG28919.1 polar amino acid transport system substrate-binding protein [Limimonas halophila]